MTDEERRKFPRIESINLAYLHLDEKNHIKNHGNGKTINISEEGFLIETNMEINSGHSIIALIELPENSVELKGTIVHCKPAGENKFIVGVNLIEAHENGKSLWKKHIDQLININKIIE
jgi:Tfp pilus assembly protein PilZ